MTGFAEAIEKQKRHRCFMDGIDWQHHLKGDSKGTWLFPTKANLVNASKHPLEECGIVEVEVRLIRWVIPQDLDQ